MILKVDYTLGGARKIYSLNKSIADTNCKLCIFLV